MRLRKMSKSKIDPITLRWLKSRGACLCGLELFKEVARIDKEASRDYSLRLRNNEQLKRIFLRAERSAFFSEGKAIRYYSNDTDAAETSTGLWAQLLVFLMEEGKRFTENDDVGRYNWWHDRCKTDLSFAVCKHINCLSCLCRSVCRITLAVLLGHYFSAHGERCMLEATQQIVAQLEARGGFETK